MSCITPPHAYPTTPVAYPTTPDAAITAMGPPELHRSHIDDHFHEIDPIPFNLIEDDNLSPLEPEHEYSDEAGDPYSENPEPTSLAVEAHNANMDQTNAKMEEDHGRPY
jgi:hypothetical protein